MTISVTTDTTTTPPRNTITVNSGTGSIMSACSIWRNDAAGQTLVRTQPSTGFSSQFVYDYECPYGVGTSYSWSATYSGIGSVLFNEMWASMSAWTTVNGTWSVSGGKATATPALGSGAQVSKSITPGLYRFVLSSFSAPTGGVALFNLYTATNAQVLSLYVNNGIVWVVGSSGSGFSTGISASAPITIDMATSTATISGTGGSQVVPIAGTVADVALVLFAGSTLSAGTFGEIEAWNYTSNSTIAETSSSVTLSPVDMWLIHPTVPSLSVKVREFDTSSVGLTSIDGITNTANATSHPILGSRKPVVTTTGPRSSDTTTMQLRSYTASASSAVQALLADQTPILINIPTSWGMDFTSDFYQIGDLARQPSSPNGRQVRKDFTLPIQAVQPPVAAIQSSSWSYAALLLQYGSYNAVKARFASYSNLLADV